MLHCNRLCDTKCDPQSIRWLSASVFASTHKANREHNLQRLFIDRAAFCVKQTSESVRIARLKIDFIIEMVRLRWNTRWFHHKGCILNYITHSYLQSDATFYKPLNSIAAATLFEVRWTCCLSLACTLCMAFTVVKRQLWSNHLMDNGRTIN